MADGAYPWSMIFEDLLHSFEKEAKMAGINTSVIKAVLKELKLDLIPKTVKPLRKTEKKK